ncbi:hypothetical protein ACFSO7_04435 [Bacillus sp. CGMCC 1.16607]|uniref:hypothetical protein n=1 Tax=Bacillus sp. CGMCC 1.16607 TaxID=3351842 RepID=UPI00362521B7
MTNPKLPANFVPDFNLNAEEVALILLSSIAHEELALAHLMNAEAEKLQAVVGTLMTPSETTIRHDIGAKTFEELVEIDRSVERMLQTIIKKEMLLQFKFDNVLEFLDKFPTNPNVDSCNDA